MKAISLYPPQAALVAAGLKTAETRSWRTKHRGRLAIHATLRYPLGLEIPGWLIDWSAHVMIPFERGRPNHGRALPLHHAAVVCTVRVADCVRTDDLAAVGPEWGWIGPLEGVPARYAVGDAEVPLGDYSPGRHVWLLDDVRRFKRPVSTRGDGLQHQGLWTWNRHKRRGD